MGIESDQVVYEYLSRVGDVAQQQQLSSATRMRLVADLRNEIDRRRAKATVDSPAAVRRILTRLGSPDEVVAAASDGSGAGPAGAAPDTAPAAVPVQREREPQGRGERPRGVRRVVPRPRQARAGEEDRPAAAEGAAPPHLAAAHELGDTAVEPDWWRVDGSPFGVGDEVPGFVGGVELPDLLKPPPRKPEKPEKPEQGAPGGPAGAEAAPAVETAPAAGETGGRRRFPSLPSAGWNNPFLLVAAGLLVAGAVLGNWFVLLLGWLLAYASRRLTPAETKWTVAVLPGLCVAGGLVWLWGRMNGRWGDPVAEGHLNDAVAETWPWVVRAAAVTSALFLVWRSQRRR
ncbi:hypothetical protein ACFY3O_30700 [Streptomyces sp. NPDC001046]|uniref:hypothetical protein n=1 Tax=Streptomyces sp. NPDC001046 TaxID=3364543 RepID=UPI0036BD63A9